MKTYLTKYILFLLVLFSLINVHEAKSQILISILLGDKLNTGKLEFGLEGGFNRSYLPGISNTKGLNNFHLGFYFDYKVKNNWYINTGVRVKSSTGARELTPYSLDDADLDTVFFDGHVTRKINYFYVPLHAKYMFAKGFFVNLGFQVGLRYKAMDMFYNTYRDKDDVEFTNGIRNNTTVFDFGLSGGAGYKFQGTGMSLGITYYQGLVDIMKGDEENTVNSTFYIYVDIPIGSHYKEDRKKSKE
jgi:hypothetical protein